MTWTGRPVSMQSRDWPACLAYWIFAELCESSRDATCRHFRNAQGHMSTGSERGPTQPHRPLQYRIEHRRQITRRGIDDLQHLGGRSLLLQRLALLGHQTRVLDRYHRLIGKGADKLDLSLGKWLNTLTRKKMTPIGWPSRKSGTPSAVRCLPSLIAGSQYPGTAATS